MTKLINFGHDMSESAIEKASELLGSPVEYIEKKMLLSFDVSITSQIKSIIDHLVDCEGDYAIALPGSSAVTAGVIATLAGFANTLPRVVMMAKTGSEFMPIEVVDLHDVKIAARMRRDKNAIKLG